MNAKRELLLTGAGFTKNFGAPLAAEMWSLILGSPRLKGQSRVRELLLADFDFESVYSHVQDDNFSPSEREALTRAVKEAYLYIDTVVEPTPHSLDVYGVQKLIAAFSGSREEPGFVFTLNQDLFLERHYYNGQRPTLPGIRHGQGWFTSHFGSPTSLTNVCMLPSEAAPTKSLLTHDEFFYIKLHGSMNWYSSRGDGQKLVIGRAKEAQISEEPLLARYMEIFRNVLTLAEHKLLVVGYGFADRHINRVLLDGMAKGLQLSVLAPGSPEDLKTLIHAKGCGELWGALAEHFPFELRTVFPPNQVQTAQWEQIQRCFFGRTIQ